MNGCIDGTGLEAPCAAQGLHGSSGQGWCSCALEIPALGASVLVGEDPFSLTLTGWEVESLVHLRFY